MGGRWLLLRASMCAFVDEPAARGRGRGKEAKWVTAIAVDAAVSHGNHLLHFVCAAGLAAAAGIVLRLALVTGFACAS